MGSTLTAKWLHLIITGVSGTIMTAQQIPFLSSSLGCVFAIPLWRREIETKYLLLFLFTKASLVCAPEIFRNCILFVIIGSKMSQFSLSGKILGRARFVTEQKRYVTL